jgi:hypothetical protein
MRLAELKHLAPELHALLGRFGASNLAVFGSVARDQAGPDSDVDLLVDLPEGISLFDRAESKPWWKPNPSASDGTARSPGLGGYCFCYGSCSAISDP